MTTTCLAEGKPCHWDSSLGNCCSNDCNQLEGQLYGTCRQTSSTTSIPNATTTSTTNTTSSNTSNPSGSNSTPQDDDEACIRDGGNCRGDASLGICCSLSCLQYPGKLMGKCRPKLSTPDESTKTVNGSNLPLILGICFAVFAVALLVVIIILLRRMKKDFMTKAEVYRFLRGAPQEASQDLPTHEKVDILPYDASFEILPSNFIIDNNSILGSGAYGIVKKGNVKLFPNSEPVLVAVKTTPEGVDPKYVKALLSELKLMIYIGGHANVVTLLGACTAELKKGRVYLLLEFCEMGSLENFLRKHKHEFQDDDDDSERSYANVPSYHLNPETLTKYDLFRWSQQIANGLEYLSSKKVVHGDLATRNVLLVTRELSKISDFGLSRRVYDYTNYVKKQQEPLPWKWMAIESLQELSFSTQSDVWAFGVTIWEIFSLGSTPYPGLSWSTDFVQNLINNLRLPLPIHGTPELYDLLCNCWKLIPANRPTPENIQQELTRLILKRKKKLSSKK